MVEMYQITEHGFAPEKQTLIEKSMRQIGKLCYGILKNNSLLGAESVSCTELRLFIQYISRVRIKAEQLEGRVDRPASSFAYVTRYMGERES
jgi:hypothetical protein